MYTIQKDSKYQQQEEKKRRRKGWDRGQGRKTIKELVHARPDERVLSDTCRCWPGAAPGGVEFLGTDGVETPYDLPILSQPLSEAYSDSWVD